MSKSTYGPGNGDVLNLEGNVVNIGDALEMQGYNGFEVVDDTTLHEGTFIRIIVIEDATFTTLTGNSTVTLPHLFKAGEDLAGKWTQLQLSAGEIRVYTGVDV